jgi:hypothetical protein
MRRLCLFLVLASAGVSVAAPSHAVTRAGAEPDKQDTTAVLSGPRHPDIEQIRATYDEAAGSITFTARFYESIANTQSSHVVEVRAAREGSRYDGFKGSCYGADIVSSAYVATTTKQGQTSAAGAEGTTSAGVTVSPDGRELTMSSTHSLFAGRDLRCLDAEVYVPDPDGHCSPSNSNCQSIRYRYVYDELDQVGYFDGYAPSPPPTTPPTAAPLDEGTREVEPQCSDGIDNDNDGDTDLDEDWGCTSKFDHDERLKRLPRLAAAEAEGFLRKALKRKFAFIANSSWYRPNCKRESATSFRCRPLFGAGDTSFSGRVDIWARAVGEQARWYSSMRIVQTDEYCAFVRKGNRCTKVYREKTRLGGRWS